LYSYLYSQLNLLSSGKETSRSKKVTAIKLSESIKFDGKLNESIYSQRPVGGFIQREPEEGKPASEEYQCMGYVR
jgi:hypothetical protein